MARVRGFLQLQGSMGETTFMTQKKGNICRAQDKLVISPDRFKKDPKFARVRENASEFTRAATGAALLRDSIRSLLKDVKDKDLSARMMSKMMAVIKTDGASPRGGGKLTDGDLTIFQNFKFNAATDLKKVLYPLIVSQIDRVMGLMTVTIPSFVPSMDLQVPVGTTHFQFVLAGIEADFEHGTFKTDIQKSEQQLYQNVATPAITLTLTATPGSRDPLFVVFGIKFFNADGSVMTPLLSASTNVLDIVAVNKA